jgi:hypothetical protein
MEGYSFFIEKELAFRKEHRANRRCKYNSKFNIESVNSKKVNIEVLGVDLSISGIGFMSEVSVEVGNLLEIAFKYNNVTIPVIVEVKHVNIYDSVFFIGGQFMALQNSYRNILKN